MKIDAFEVRTSDLVKGSTVPEGYVHVLIVGVVSADDADALNDAAASGKKIEVALTEEASDYNDDQYEKVLKERELLKSRGRL